jgi:hypothetical protein
VRNASGQGADALEALGPEKLGLEFLALRDVANASDYSQDAAALVAGDKASILHRGISPILSFEPVLEFQSVSGTFEQLLEFAQHLIQVILVNVGAAKVATAVNVGTLVTEHLKERVV